MKTEGITEGTYSSDNTTVKFYYRAFPVTSLTIHYYNTNWSNVNIYSYDKNETKQYTGVWPGTDMTNDGDGWWSYNLSDIENALVIFNNGTNQEPSNLQPGYDISCESWIKDGNVLTEEPKDDEPDPEPSDVCIYFDNSSYNWSNVYAYVYNENGQNAQYIAKWPGVKMTQDTEGGYFVLNIAEGFENGNVIFSDGTGYASNRYPADMQPGLQIQGVSHVLGKNYRWDYYTKASISLDKTSAEVEVDKTVSLKATVIPNDAAVVWTSSDDSVATVSDTGVVKGIKAGTATVTAALADYPAVMASATITVNAPPVISLENTSTISSSTVILSKNVTVNASANGGTAPYRYEIIYKLSSDSNWKTLQDYSSNSSVSFTPEKSGTYYIRVTVKDNDSTMAEKNISLTVNAPTLENTSVISATEIDLGETISITASAKGGTGTYQYQIVYKQKSATSWSTIQSYSTNSTASFRPLKQGDYDLCIKVKDSQNSEVKKYFDITVKQLVPLENTSTLSSLNINLGEKITVECSAKGGTGEYRYQVVYKQETQEKWSTAQPYSMTESVDIKPAKPVVYDICVKVKDSVNTEVKKFYKVTVTDNRPKNISSISAETVEVGDVVVVKAKASGSTGFFQYAVFYKKAADTKWTTKQNFKSNSTVAIQPTKATTYQICVKIKDDKGTVVKKYFNVEVTEHNDKLSNTSTVSETSVLPGETVIVTASASGSTGFYQYAVSYREENGANWIVMQEYSTEDSCKFKPASEGKYEICVSVKDNLGNEAKKYFTVTASSAE